MYTALALAFVLFFGAAAAAPANPVPMSHPFPSSGIPIPLPPLGGASHDSIVKFEDVKKLSPPMSAALGLLRAHQYEAAQAAFQKVQQSRPQEALAYRGEIEASQRLNTLEATVVRYRKRLAAAEQGKERGTNRDVRLAVLHWALGEAVMMRNGYYTKFIAQRPSILGGEPREQFQEALQLDPDLLVAYLSLAAYYEHASQEKGSLARLEYQEALRLRPNLYQIRYLHALTWDRPGILVNEAQLIKQGFHWPEDKKKMPEKAIPEYLGLIRDHPKYAPPYYCLADDYWFIDKTKSKFYYEKYLELGNPEGRAWKRAKSIVDALNAQSAKSASRQR